MEIKPFETLFSTHDVDAVLKDFKDIILRGGYVLGEFTHKLEREILSWHAEVKEAILVSSGTSALECVFEYIRSKFGSGLVAVQSNTNFATVSSIIRSGLTPVFVDCDCNGQLSLIDLKSKHDEYSFSSIALVHIGGYISRDYEEILEFCENNSITVIEDAAHAHGSKSTSGIGERSLAAILSFFPTKVVNGGEGGAILTKNEELAKFCRAWRNQGKIDAVYGNDHHILGGSNRMPELNCALCLLSYSKLRTEIDRRNEISVELIDGVKNIEFQDFRYLDGFSNYKLIGRKKGILGSEIEIKLKQSGIICGGAVYRTPCHKQPVFRGYQLGSDALQETKDFCADHFCLPLHSNITLKQVSYMKEKLREI